MVGGSIDATREGGDIKGQRERQIGDNRDEESEKDMKGMERVTKGLEALS